MSGPYALTSLAACAVGGLLVAVLLLRWFPIQRKDQR
jgi:hypothetical protein